MKLNILYVIAFIAMALFLSNCNKDNSSKPQVPVSDIAIQAKSATVYISGGVTLNGTINKIPDNLTEYGFLLGTDSLFATAKRFKVNQTASIGNFKLDINTGLLPNKIYYFTTYSISSSTSGFIKYNTLSFNSSGSKKIKIDSISPLKADLGDTITIKGKYFLNQQLIVKFGNQSTYPTVLNDSVFKCTVPTDLDQANPLVTVLYNGLTDTITNKFSLNTPVISNFTPLATFRDTVTINGDHFGFQNSLNQVSFGGVSATIISSTRKQLKVLVPDNIANSYTNINVKAQVQTVTSTTTFQIRPPVITIVTPTNGYVNDVITIKGKYFHPTASSNSIYCGINLAQYVSGNTTQLNFNIPNGSYPQRTATIQLKLLDYTVTYNITLSINDKWVVVNGQVPFNVTEPTGSFTINNVSYVVARSQDYTNNQKYLWKLNPSDFSWHKIIIPFNFTNGFVTSNGIKAYMYASTDGNNFWEYDPASNIWTEKANYPAAVRQYATMFAIGSKVYLGLGSTTQQMIPNTTDDTFYSYDITSDTWQQIANFPDNPNTGMRNLASAFVVNNKAYVGCGATNTGMLKCYSYSPSLNTWARIADFPDARLYTTSFSFGNYGYIATGTPIGGSPTRDCFKYDPNSDTWTKLTDYIGCNSCDSGIDVGYSFVNGGFVYVGGGNHEASNFQLLQAVGSGL